MNQFSGFIIFGILSCLLVIGLILRNRVKLFQDYMLPASLLGGIVGFVVINLGILKFGDWVITPKDFSFFVFHGFNISYVSLMLTPPSESTANQTKEVLRGGIWQSIMWCIALTVQGLLGWCVVKGFNAFSGNSVSELLGALVANGFAQGPGQGYTVGLIWEGHGIPDAATLGMIYGAVGFLVAVVVGVPWARWFIQRKLNTNKRAAISQEFLRGVYDKDTVVPSGRETIHASTLDTFSYHVALVGIVYLFTYAEVQWLETTVRPVLADIPGMKAAAWMCSMPMFYMHAMFNALALRLCMQKFSLHTTLDRHVQNRITGIAVDVLIVATLTSIQFMVLAKYIIPISLVCIASTIVTFYLFLYFGRRKKNFGPESSLAQFGAATGSSASGMLLLRIVDPDFSTPAAKELAVFNVLGMILGAIVIYVWAPGLFEFSTFEFFACYGLYTIVMLIILYLMKFVDKKQW